MAYVIFPRDLQGMVARCSRGELGLITSATMVEVTYPGCATCGLAQDAMVHRFIMGDLAGAHPYTPSKGTAWTGIHLGAAKFGQPWSSRTPKVLYHVAEAAKMWET
jgi:hypothetical protein